MDPELVAWMTPQERELLRRIGDDGKPWHPLPGKPQEEAYRSPADIVGYGGAAGGGKTALACGLALCEHQKVGIFRDTGTELTAIIDYIGEVLGSRDGFNGAERIWRTKRHDGKVVQIEFGSFPNPGDETKYQGRPHDLLVFDEAANMRESQVRFLMGWLRSTDPGQRKRVLLTFNPPTSAEGRWVVEFFGPWLDDKHPNPAKPGELRWFATIDGKDREVDGPRPFVLVENEPVYEFDAKTVAAADVIQPMSRTFIPSRVEDNPFLAGTGYMRMLQALPEPLRSQMLRGDFRAGMEDDPYQVIPTAWVEAAMARWKPQDAHPTPMDSVGVDVAMGGRDETVIMCRHGNWYAEPIAYPGRECVSGSQVAGLIIAATRDAAPIHLDVFGVGAQPYGHLERMGVQVLGVVFGDPAPGPDLTGLLKFFNLRSYLWWMAREALDPVRRTGIALPPNRKLLADLCAPKWEPRGRTVFVESREDIVKRIGRSPDYATAFILAMMDTPKTSQLRDLAGGKLDETPDYNPFSGVSWR